MEVVSQMASDQVSLVLDMGASDTALEELAKQMNICEFCEASGIRRWRSIRWDRRGMTSMTP